MVILGENEKWFPAIGRAVGVEPQSKNFPSSRERRATSCAAIVSKRKRKAPDNVTLLTKKEKCGIMTMRTLAHFSYIAGSANGRPIASGAIYLGSNPSPAASTC